MADIDKGIRDLARLLARLEPVLGLEQWVFVTVKGCYRMADLPNLASLDPLACYREAEGLSLVLEKGIADREGFPYPGVFSCIRLTVHSSLLALGLTAAVAGCLAEKGISANVIAAYHHDHVLVPEEHSRKAMTALQELSLKFQRG